jgi:hypothetical protein
MLALAMVLAIAAGCEQRDRSNPFDPGNPDTGGVPPLLDAQAGNGETALYWNLEGFDGLVTTRIQRRWHENAIKVLTPKGLPPSDRTYLDSSPQNNVLYEYRLEIELVSGDRVYSRWDEATPGDAIPWVADGEGGGLSRLTPDARDRTFSFGGGRWFLDLAIDTLTSTVWAVDFLEGFLFQLAFDGELLRRIPVAGARAVDIDLGGGGVWVGSFDRMRLERRHDNGELAWSDESAGAVEDLLALPAGGVWLCNREGELRLYRNDEPEITKSDLDRPVALARSTAETVHVLERGGLRVSRYDVSGFHLGSSAQVLGDPLDLCDDGSGGVWVADPGRGGLVRFDSRLKELAFVPLDGVFGVTWDERDQTLWVAGRFGVQILDRQGQFISGAGLGPRPLKVEVVHGAATR